MENKYLDFFTQEFIIPVCSLNHTKSSPIIPETGYCITE